MINSRMFLGDPSQFSFIGSGIFSLPLIRCAHAVSFPSPYQLSTANDRPAQPAASRLLLRREAGLCVSRKAHLCAAAKTHLLLGRPFAAGGGLFAMGDGGHVRGEINHRLPLCGASPAKSTPTENRVGGGGILLRSRRQGHLRASEFRN
jgi:hypothetical protein